jgi:flagellar biosynthesis protein FlhG
VTLKMSQHMVRDDQATRLREMVARLDRARDAHAAVAHPDRVTNGDLRLDRTPEVVAPKIAARKAKVIAIASGKGGVGKTSLSVNLCAALAKYGVRVALLDGDFGLANADLLCGVRVSKHLGHVLEGVHTLEDVLVETAAGFSLAPGASGMSALGRASNDDRRILVDRLASAELRQDIVVIDCGAGMGAGVLSFLRDADVLVVVTTPEPTAIADSYALIKCLHLSDEGAHADRSAPRLLVNQAGDAAEALAASQRIAAVAKRFLGLEISSLGWTPMDSAVSDAVRGRCLFVEQSPRSDASQAVRRIARNLQTELVGMDTKAKQNHGAWGRLFRLSRRVLPKKVEIH